MKGTVKTKAGMNQHQIALPEILVCIQSPMEEGLLVQPKQNHTMYYMSKTQDRLINSINH